LLSGGKKLSIECLNFAEPFFELDYVENEESYWVEGKSVVINLAHKSRKPMWINGTMIPPLKSTVAENAAIEKITKALIVKSYMKYDFSLPQEIEKIKLTWKSLYEWSGKEEQRGIPYYKTAKIRVGNDTAITICFAEAMSPSGSHRDHAGNIDEVHAQIQGIGKIQMFMEKDTNTFYQEYIMAPGNVHDVIYDADGNYPWHQYHSVTPSVYIPIEIDR